MPRTCPASSRRHLGAMMVVASLLAGIGAAAEPGPIRFNTNFEGASLGKIEPLGEAAFRCHVKGQQNEHGRNRQASWYYFRVEGARDRDLTLTMTDFVGEYNGKPGACPMGPGIIPVVSDDGERWRPISDITWDDRTKEATLRIRPQRDTIWIAHQPPYTHSRLARLLEQVERCDDARIEVIGKTAMGRDLHLITVTAADVADRDKVTVWLQARQHAWESGTSYVMEGALRFITSDDPKARALRRRVVFAFTPMVDPDGSATGQVRFNANGFDVNRHWDEVDLRDKRFLARMPEIWYVKKAIASHVASGRKVHLMINLHNTETGEYLSTRAGDEASRALVGKLSDRLIRETAFRPSHGPVFAERPDGAANALHDQLGILILLMEQRIANDSRTGRPTTVEDRLRFGEQLIGIMAEAVLP
jgi:Zinc carboxypeptidase/Cytosolic carboxypeptidase N-terminal domain